MSEPLELEIRRLVEAMQEQAKAINALAQSNAALIEAMAEAEYEGEDMPSATYLDGSSK